MNFISGKFPGNAAIGLGPHIEYHSIMTLAILGCFVDRFYRKLSPQV